MYVCKFIGANERRPIYGVSNLGGFTVIYFLMRIFMFSICTIAASIKNTVHYSFTFKQSDLVICHFMTVHDSVRLLA